LNSENELRRTLLWDAEIAPLLLLLLLQSAMFCRANEPIPTLFRIPQREI